MVSSPYEKKLMSWVIPGLDPVFTRPFFLTKALMRLDLPQLDRP